MTWFNRVRDALDHAQRRHAWSSLPFALVRKMSDDQGGNLAALTAYYGFLALFPLLLCFASILGFVLAGDPGLRARVVSSVARSFPGFAGTIDSTISGNGVALGVGLVIALWAGLGVTRAMEGAMNAIWYIPLASRPNLWRSRLRGVAMLTVLGVTFVVSSALAGLQGTHVIAPAAANVLSVLGPLLLNVGLYVMAFVILTNRHLAWRDVLPGAIVGAVGWTLLQDLGAYYTRHEIAHASHLYGPLALVVGLLAWIYLGAQLTLYAAQLNVVHAERLWPRSLNGFSTEADRRSLLLRARVLQRVEGPVISVDFGEPTSPRSPSSVGLDDVIGDLREFAACRAQLDDERDPARRVRLEARLAATARNVTDSLRVAAASEPTLADALTKSDPTP